MVTMEDPEILLVGLDFETTGLDVATLRPLQIGVFVPDAKLAYDAYLRYENYGVLLEGNDSFQAAAAIHEIPVDEIVYGKPILEAEHELYYLLAPLAKEYTLVATGFGVGPFDMEILRRWFPRVHALFSHRVIDPNTLLHREAVRLARAQDRRPTMADLKFVKEDHQQFIVDEYMRGHWNEHDALWDARFGVFSVIDLEL